MLVMAPCKQPCKRAIDSILYNCAVILVVASFGTQLACTISDRWIYTLSHITATNDSETIVGNISHAIGSWRACCTVAGDLNSTDHYPLLEGEEDAMLYVPIVLTSATVLTFSSTVCCLCALFQSHRAQYVFSAGVLLIVSGIISFTGIIYFVATVSKTFDVYEERSTFTYGLSFHLAVVSFILEELIGSTIVHIFITLKRREMKKQCHELPILSQNSNDQPAPSSHEQEEGDVPMCLCESQTATQSETDASRVFSHSYIPAGLFSPKSNDSIALNC